MTTRDLGIPHEFFRPVRGTPTRALLLLHGTGGDERQMLSLGQEIDPAAALLSPRGQVREGSANRFFRRLAEGVFDMEDLVARTEELAAFVRHARKAYDVDRLPLIAVGYSNGANIALSLLLRSPATLAGAILLRAMPQEPPSQLPALAGTPVLLSAGERDGMVSPGMRAALRELLLQCGADVTTSVQHAGHELAREDLSSAQAWLGEIGTLGGN